MDVLIAGAGIAGLAAAIVLRENGHRVRLFEQTSNYLEAGAAILLPPNANGLLRRYGFMAEDYGGNLHLGSRSFNHNGDLLHSEDHPDGTFASPWHMIHRQRLHTGLKHRAVDPAHRGHPAKVETYSKVISVDVDEATITLEDGRTAKGDVVLGADGIWSKTRAAVQVSYAKSQVDKPFSSGQNCFRFMIPRKDLLENPTTRAVYQEDNVFLHWQGENRRLVSYPCDNNTNINCVAIHPSSMSEANFKDWHGEGSSNTLVEIFSDFDPVVQEITKLAKPGGVKLYPLMDLAPMPTWVNKKLALLGDAAHPFLPFMGQGGAQAIEDAISLGVFLDARVTPDQVPERLKLYEQSRMERAHRIQESTRKQGMDMSHFAQLQDYSMEQEFGYCLAYDQLQHSRDMLASRRRRGRLLANL